MVDINNVNIKFDPFQEMKGLLEKQQYKLNTFYFRIFVASCFYYTAYIRILSNEKHKRQALKWKACLGFS